MVGEGGQLVGGQLVGGQLVGGQLVGGQLVGGQLAGGQLVGEGGQKGPIGSPKLLLQMNKKRS